MMTMAPSGSMRTAAIGRFAFCAPLTARATSPCLTFLARLGRLTDFDRKDCDISERVLGADPMVAGLMFVCAYSPTKSGGRARIQLVENRRARTVAPLRVS